MSAGAGFLNDQQYRPFLSVAPGVALEIVRTWQAKKPQVKYST